MGLFGVVGGSFPSDAETLNISATVWAEYCCSERIDKWRRVGQVTVIYSCSCSSLWKPVGVVFDGCAVDLQAVTHRSSPPTKGVVLLSLNCRWQYLSSTVSSLQHFLVGLTTRDPVWED